MATDGVSGNQQFDVYEVNYKKDIKPKDDQGAHTLFNALWDEVGYVLLKADANRDGVVDKNDMPKMQKLIGILQDAQETLAKNIKNFSFDAGGFKYAFATFEKEIQKIINEITDGTYIARR